MADSTGIYVCRACMEAKCLRRGDDEACPACQKPMELVYEAPENDESETWAEMDPLLELESRIVQEEDAEFVSVVPDTDELRVWAKQSVTRNVAVWTSEEYEPVYRDGEVVGMALQRVKKQLGQVIS